MIHYLIAFNSEFVNFYEESGCSPIFVKLETLKIIILKIDL